MNKLRVSPGYASIEDEFEATLRRAFVDNSDGTIKVDFIIVDSRRQLYLLECINWAVRKGWLSQKLNQIEEQYSRLEGRLTLRGKQHFGLPYKRTYPLSFDS